MPLSARRRRPAHVVLIVRIAAVDDDVPGLHAPRQPEDRLFGRVPGRDHDPGRARLGELDHEIVERAGPDGALRGQLLDALRMEIEGDALMPAAEQAPHHVGAHATQADHPQLHVRDAPYCGAPHWRPSMARVLASRRWCRPSPENVAPRKARTNSLATSVPMTRAPSTRTFMSVMPDALVSRIGVVTEARPNPEDLVGRHRGADSTPADDYPAVGPPFGQRPANCLGIIR